MGRTRRTSHGMSYREAMASREKGKARQTRTRPRDDSIENAMFQARTRGAVDDSPAQTFLSALPTNTKALADNYAPRSIRSAAIGQNQVDTYQLNTSGNDNAAVSAAACQTAFLVKRHYGAGESPDLTSGVQVPIGRLIAGTAGANIDINLLPNYGASKLPNTVVYGTTSGKVDRNAMGQHAVHPKDHIDWEVKAENFIPLSMLKSRPWPSVHMVKQRTTDAQVKVIAKKLIKDMVRVNSLKPKYR